MFGAIGIDVVKDENITVHMILQRMTQILITSCCYRMIVCFSFVESQTVNDL